MPDFPITALQGVVSFSTLGHEGAGTVLSAAAISAPASATWPSANEGILVPLRIPNRATVSQFWAYNGSVAAGNIDIGLYTMAGTRLGSTGSTAQAGTSVLQVIDVTDFQIGPGTYYLAVAASSTSATFVRATGGTLWMVQAAGQVGANGVVPLTATITLSATGRNYIPYAGFNTKGDM